MAPQLLYESELGDAALGELQYEEGDRIIVLPGGNYDTQHLLLNSEVLDRASMFFANSKHEGWDTLKKNIVHPYTKQLRTVLKYFIAYNPESETMTLNKVEVPTGSETLEVLIWKENRIAVFYLSDEADGFVRRQRHEGDHRTFDSEKSRYIHDVCENHKKMFALLFEGSDRSAYSYHFGPEDIAEIAAYAELYDLLGAIAPALRDVYEGLEFLWRDVKNNCHFHIALATKVRSEVVFLDAMRHFIGSRSDLSDLTNKLFFDAGYAFEIACVRECQRKRIAVLMEDIQGLTLATCIPDTGPRFIGPGKPLKTCFFSSTHIQGHHERVQGIARRIFMEWFNHQVYGEKHQAFMEARTWDSNIVSPNDANPVTRDSTHGVRLPSSVRNACTLALGAAQNGDQVELFDINAAEAFVRAYSLAASPYTTLEVQAELKMLVNEMANLARPLLAEPESQPVQPHVNAWSIDYQCTQRYPPGFPQHEKSTHGRGRDRGYRDPSPVRGSGTIPTGTYGYAHTFINDELNEQDRRETSHTEQAWRTHRYGMTAKDEDEVHYFTATRRREIRTGFKACSLPRASG